LPALLGLATLRNTAKRKDETLWQGTNTGDDNTHTYGNVLLIR
jgi:hypothetical protein